MYEIEAARALELLNLGRSALDLPPLTELPKGQLANQHYCVVARGLELDRAMPFERCASTSVSTTTKKAEALGRAWGTARSGRVVGLPPILAEIAGAETRFAQTLDVAPAEWGKLAVDPAYLPPESGVGVQVAHEGEPAESDADGVGLVLGGSVVTDAGGPSSNVLLARVTAAYGDGLPFGDANPQD